MWWIAKIIHKDAQLHQYRLLLVLLFGNLQTLRHEQISVPDVYLLCLIYLIMISSIPNIRFKGDMFVLDRRRRRSLLLDTNSSVFVVRHERKHYRCGVSHQKKHWKKVFHTWMSAAALIFTVCASLIIKKMPAMSLTQYQSCPVAMDLNYSILGLTVCIPNPPHDQSC